jgi:hypothetical protein
MPEAGKGDSRLPRLRLLMKQPLLQHDSARSHKNARTSEWLTTRFHRLASLSAQHQHHRLQPGDAYQFSCLFQTEEQLEEHRHAYKAIRLRNKDSG